jgi:hypothetical protein
MSCSSVPLRDVRNLARSALCVSRSTSASMVRVFARSASLLFSSPIPRRASERSESICSWRASSIDVWRMRLETSVNVFIPRFCRSCARFRSARARSMLPVAFFDNS